MKTSAENDDRLHALRAPAIRPGFDARVLALGHEALRDSVKARSQVVERIEMGVYCSVAAMYFAFATHGVVSLMIA